MKYNLGSLDEQETDIVEKKIRNKVTKTTKKYVSLEKYEADINQLKEMIYGISKPQFPPLFWSEVITEIEMEKESNNYASVYQQIKYKRNSKPYETIMALTYKILEKKFKENNF